VSLAALAVLNARRPRVGGTAGPIQPSPSPGLSAATPAVNVTPTVISRSGTYINSIGQVVITERPGQPDQFSFGINVQTHFVNDSAGFLGALAGTAKWLNQSVAEYTSAGRFGETCRVSFTFRGNQVVLQETPACSSYHGAGISFDGTYVRSGSRILPATQPSPSPATALTGIPVGPIGVPECDNYLANYDACVSSHVPETARAQYYSALQQTRDSWRKLAADPKTKGTLAAACRQAAQEQAVTLKSYGCDFDSSIPTPSVTSTRPANADVYIDKLVMVKNDNAKPGEETATFAPGDRTIYGVVGLNKAKAGTNVKFVWNAVDVESAKNEVIKTIDYTTKTFENKVIAHLTLPGNWPKGKYRLDVYINGNLDKSIEYTIE
jgi:hypothetical protein